MAKKKKPHGYYCKVCGSYRPNEQFSGKGRKQHICKKCMQLPQEERKRRMCDMDDYKVYEPLAGRDTDELDFNEMTERLFGDFDHDDLDMLATAMLASDSFGFDALLNAGFYNYKQPDYSTMCHPVELHLYPLYRAETTEELVMMMDRLAEVTEKMEPGRREESVRNLLLNVLADYQRDRTIREQAMLGALWTAERFRLTGIGDTLLELLRQNAEFYTSIISCNEPVLTLAISQVCADQLPMLLDYVMEDGLIPDGQSIVCDSVIQMALSHPERRQEVIDWMADVLEHFMDPDVDATPAVIDHVAYSLLQIRAVELLPLLKDAYQIYNVPKIECRGGYRWLKKMMVRGVAPRIQLKSIDLLLKMYLILEDDEEDEQDEWNDDDDASPSDEPLPVDPFYKDTDQKLKLMTIEVKLTSAPADVTRTLTVPSNLRLSCLAEVLVMAMGWQKSCEQYFYKSLCHYTDAESAASFGALGCDWTQYAVGEIVSRKGAEMNWTYNQGDGKSHTVCVTNTKPIKPGALDHKVSLIAATGSVEPGKTFDLSKARQEIDDCLCQILPF